MSHRHGRPDTWKPASAGFVVLAGMFWGGLTGDAVQGQSGQPTQTLKSAVQAVEVDVRAFKGGQFAAGLSLEDFSVWEDGVAQKIQSFSLVRRSISSSTPGGSPAAALPSPSGVAPPTPPGVWLFVFDTGHLTGANLKRSKDAALEFVQSRFDKGDLAGAVAQGQVINGHLTQDRGELAKAIAGIKISSELDAMHNDITRTWPRFLDDHEVIAASTDSRVVEQVAQRACADDPTTRGFPAGSRGACQSIAESEVRQKAAQYGAALNQQSHLTLAEIEQLAQVLAAGPGPKTLILFSEGFVTERMEPELERAVALAGRAGIHVYAIDARGLNKGRASSDMIDRPAPDPMGQRPLDHADANADSLNSLAIDTGGLLIQNENNLGRALDEAQDDAGSYYLIGYTPTNSAFDGKFRRITVKVGQAGVQVRARMGYLAIDAATLNKHGSGGHSWTQQP